MARGFQRRLTRGASRPLRPMEWKSAQVYDFSEGMGNGSAGTFCSWILQPTFLDQEFTDPTVMATRMLWQFQATGTPVLSTMWAAGVIVWDGYLNNLPDVCPSPLDGSLDWLVRQVHPYAETAPNALGTPQDSIYYSKARRKLEKPQGVLFVVQLPVASFFAADVRILLKA